MRKNILALAAVVLGLSIFGCSQQPSPTSPTSDSELPPYTEELASVTLSDGASYTLTAKTMTKTVAGKELEMLAYNGSIPGPSIRVQQGSTIFLTLDNQTDAPTLLHSHGVRLKNAFDGTDMTQKEIPAGGSFRYEITFPDPGIYWYHPHLREDYQQDMGLYGVYIVEPKEENYWAPVNKEEVIVLDDLLLQDGDLAPYGENAADHALMGRYGNTPLLNGSAAYHLQVKQGELVRFYIVNAANARPFNFALGGVRMKLVGGDNGKVEQETFVDHIILAPSERDIIEVLFPKIGYFFMVNRIPQGDKSLGTITVTPGAPEKNLAADFDVLKKNEDISTDIDRYRPFFDKPPEKQLNIGLNMMGMSMGSMGMMGGSMGTMSEHDKIEWEDNMQAMNAQSDSSLITWKLIDPETGKENMDVDWKFKKGDIVKIRIFNDPKSVHPMQHPIHIHGQRFLVLSTNGTKNSELVWKDTVLVPVGDTVDILADMTNPGTWMLHCHIAEHLESKMAMKFIVQ